jgi:hypothetical protein
MPLDDKKSPPSDLNEAITLTSEQAKTLLRGDLANLAKKVKGGKTLSASERNILQSALAGDKPSGVEYCDTIIQLAELIGVTRKTIQRWRKIEGSPEPRPDGRWHVPSWRQFKIQRHGEDGTDDDDVTQASARCKQILLQNERLTMRILVEKKDLIPKVIAQQIFSKLILSAKTRCFSSVTRFVTLARMAETSTAAAEEIRKEMILIWQSLESGKWLK